MKETCLFSKLECLISTYTPRILMLCHVNDYALHEKLKMTMNMHEWHITLIFEDAASTKCLKVPVSHASLQESSAVHWHCREGSCSLPCLSSGAFSCLSDTAEKDPAVSTASLQQSPMLLFRCSLMLQQRKIDPGMLPKAPCKSTGPDPYVVCYLFWTVWRDGSKHTLPAY